jgi:hypothetical protein
MSVFSGSVAQASDNPGQQFGGAINNSATSYRLEQSGNAEFKYVGYRFENVTVANGATVSSCTISIEDTGVGSGTIDHLIDCVDAANQATFGTSSDTLSSLTLTGNPSTWAISSGTEGTSVTSADFSPAAQAVFALAGWASGNALAAVSYYTSGSGTPAIYTYNEGGSAIPSITVTYTAGGPPSAPTGVDAVADDYQSVTVTWDNPGGTLTDNILQYADNSAMTGATTVDIGSVVTSYTVTGLSPNTTYYFQVAAVNSSGTGSYSSTVSATTYQLWAAQPVADFTNYSGGGSVTFTGSSVTDSINTGSNSNNASVGGGSEIGLILGNPPAGFTSAAAVSVVVTAENSGSGSNTIGLEVDLSGYLDSFRLAGVDNTSNLTGSFAEYTVPLTVSGSYPQNASDWSGAVIGLIDNNGTGQFTFSALTVNVSYTPGPVSVPLPLAGMQGIGPCPFGVTNQMRRNRVEGVRFQHKNS